MTITAESPRGGLVEELGEATHTFVLRNREIERFEDKHRGIFDLWDGFYRGGKKPTSTEVRDLLALALVGGGLKDAQADGVLKACTPGDLLRLYEIARAVLGIAFMPDFDEKPEPKKKAAKPQAD
jgi:hypothetical protein